MFDHNIISIREQMFRLFTARNKTISTIKAIFDAHKALCTY